MTPAIDLAVKHKVRHTIHSYEHNSAAASYGIEAAEALGIDPESVFKTLVVELNTGELAVGLVPVSRSLNLKSISKAMNAKKAVMANKQKVQKVTGYVLGGVSPLGQKKSLATIIDQSAIGLDRIFVSAGKRGLEIELRPSDLAKLTRAKFATIASSN